MLSIESTELAERFFELLARAYQDEQIVVTRNGLALAILGPVVREQLPTPRDPEDIRAAVDRLREYTRGYPIPNLTPDEIKSWIEEGRP